ncbi:hypothetical protein ABE10_10915, partial [Bacillus toyonensis]|nr:hypothetical protein [Bacillus toyonensis]
PADGDRSAGHVEKAGDERDERRLARAGGPDDRHRLTGVGREADSGEHRRGGARIGELDVVEGDGSGDGEGRDAVLRTGHRRLGVEDLADALGRDRRTGDHHRHEARHDDAHHDLADVLHEREQRADLDRAVVDLDAAEPDHADDGDVEDEHEQREEQHEERADLAADDHDVGVGLAEPLLLDPLAHEGAHDPDAGELLAHDAVDRVELALVAAEQRDHPADDESGDDQERRHRDRDEPAEPEVGLQRHDDAADREERRGDEHGRAHHRQHLDLLHVVRVAGDERSGAELRDLAFGEPAHAGEDVGADVAAHAHGGAGGEVRRDDRRDDLAERDGEHERAVRPDVSGVGGGDALVDDVGVQTWQIERCQRTGELEDQHAEEQPSVAGEIADEDFSEHRRTSWIPGGRMKPGFGHAIECHEPRTFTPASSE